MKSTLALLALLAACSSGQQTAEKNAKTQPAAPATEAKAPEPVQEPLVGGPYPALLLTQAWFWKDAQGKSHPGPARLVIWRKTEQGWTSIRVEDPDSNVFHKAMWYQDGILTIGAEKAMLKKWTFADGHWISQTLWQRDWGGKFNRLRDIEVGDVDGDGKDEFVIATHDNGVVAVYNPDEPDGGVVELDPKPDTFVHEIEIGDIDGDGKNEFFATPSARNRAGASQEGAIVMYRWNPDEQKYVRTVVDQNKGTHAKEILCTDVDGDGKAELFGVFEAELGPNKEILTPVQIKLYRPQPDGSFKSTLIASIEDRQNRFLTYGDLDGDGEVELVAAAMKTGVWLLDRNGGPVDGPWNVVNIDANSSGFEHVAKVTDLDGDGKVELYVAADDQRELKRYDWNPATKVFDRKVIGHLTPDTFTWNMEPARL